MRIRESRSYTVITLQRMEVRRALSVQHLDELGTEVGIHRREQATRLDAVFNERLHDRCRFDVWDDSVGVWRSLAHADVLCENQCCFSRASRFTVNARDSTCSFISS